MAYQSEQHRWNCILSHLGLKTIKLKKQRRPEQRQPGAMTRKDPQKKRCCRDGSGRFRVREFRLRPDER